MVSARLMPLSLIIVGSKSYELPRVPEASSRRSVLQTAAASILLRPAVSHAAAAVLAPPFRTGAFGREEYTNSIVASRDTNISESFSFLSLSAIYIETPIVHLTTSSLPQFYTGPREVYDSIESQFILYPLEKLREQQESGTTQRKPRALDVGAGAGVSTQVLWDIGYREIDAVDWSGKAWERFVVEDPTASCPSSVNFYELDDERYVDMWRSQGSRSFDTIVFNFGINERKAVQFAKELLEPENGRLLAPVNVQNDYWLKQVYKVYDGEGSVVKVLGQDIGAWAVQFQPDVTQDTCQGIWCAQFNGFQRKR